MKKIAILGLTALSLFAGTTKHDPYHLEVGVFGGGVIPSDGKNMDFGSTMGVRFAGNLNSDWLPDALEYSYFTSTDIAYTNSSQVTDSESHSINGIWKYQPSPTALASLYFLVGAGTNTYTNAQYGVEDGTFISAGVGVRVKAMKYLHITADVRNHADVKGGGSELIGTVGLSIPFWYSKAEAPKEEEVEEIAPEPIKEEVKAAPKKAETLVAKNLEVETKPVVEAPKPVVETPKVQEASKPIEPIVEETTKITPPPAPKPVVKKPIDSDRDGIFDDKDVCPNTPLDFKINEEGCPTTLTLNIQFAYKSVAIAPKYQDQLLEISSYLNENPSEKIEIQGHTDNVGSAKYNLGLSKKRAKAVYDFIAKRTNKAQLSYKGIGEMEPIATNKTKDGQALNRRIEIHFKR